MRPSPGDPEYKSKTISMRMTEELNHFLDTRVLELRTVAESKKGLDKSWLMLRLMELGQDWLAAWHLGQPTDYEEWILKEIKKTERERKKDSTDLEKSSFYEGKMEGLLIAHRLFDEYETLICQIGDSEK